LGVKDGRCVRLTTLLSFVSRLSRRCGSLNLTHPYGPPRPVTFYKYCRVFATQRDKKFCGFSDSNEYLLDSHFYTHSYSYSQLKTSSEVFCSILRYSRTAVSVKCLLLCSLAEYQLFSSKVKYKLNSSLVTV
jgi:hypothetical protein